MAVYGEYLFAENFIAGMVILSVTGIWAGRRAHTGWLITGGAALRCVFIYDFCTFWHICRACNENTVFISDYRHCISLEMRRLRNWKEAQSHIYQDSYNLLYCQLYGRRTCLCGTASYRQAGCLRQRRLLYSGCLVS